MKTTEADFDAKLQQARQRLPLKNLMEGRGRGPSNGNWRSFPKCPYCDGQHCAGVFNGPHGDLFKCHRASCRSATAGDRAAWDEIGFIAYEENSDRRSATRVWIQEAGLWEENPIPTTGDSPVSVSNESIDALSDGNSGGDKNPGKPPKTGDDDETRSPLVAFFERLQLNEDDQTELRDKRGLSLAMIEQSGFRSNVGSNLAILQALNLEYDERQLVACGLWTTQGRTYKPSGQFYGWGVVGKKKRLSIELMESGDYDDLDDDEFAWASKESGKCNPIIIPYYDLNGDLIGLRPHKGFPKGQKPRLYLAAGMHAVKSARWAVITEGEFKAAALQDAMGTDWAVASVPGITQVKNFHVWGDILAWLKRIGARTVTVVFDNEERGDPKLPSFRERLEDRFDSQIWARVCALRLHREGYRSQVGHLPDEWRDANGKADWDSALASLSRAQRSPSQIRSAFNRVLKDAPQIHQIAKSKIYERQIELMIGDRAMALAYEPALPWGGKAEQRLAKDLRKLAGGKLRDYSASSKLLRTNAPKSSSLKSN